MAHLGQSKFSSAGGANEEFPILCETCLGENPFIRMTKQPHAKACKICERPFTVYRWRPGPQARYKKTELCHTCAKIKNVCQTCVLDLQFGLPVQVRDSTLSEYEKMQMPESDVGREYLIEQHEAKMGAVSVGATYGKVDKSAASSAMLSKMQRKTPYYRRNLPHLCSFYAKGTCNRGALCPYRHEMPTTGFFRTRSYSTMMSPGHTHERLHGRAEKQTNNTRKCAHRYIHTCIRVYLHAHTAFPCLLPSGPLAHQNIQDRYYGKNDPVALKMLDRMEHNHANSKPLEVPADTTISTLWVGGVPDGSSEDDIRAAFYPFGQLSSVRTVPDKKCAFVTYMRRDSAEAAAAKLYNTLKINDKACRLAWGKRQSSGPPGVSGPPGIRPAGAGAPPPGVKAGAIRYPSQNPANMAAKFSSAEH